MLASMNTILHERQLEEYYCTLCYAVVRFQAAPVVIANSGLPYPIRSVGSQTADAVRAAGPIELPGVPLGAFRGFELRRGELRAGGRRSVRVLHGRRLRGEGRVRTGVRRGAALRSCWRARDLPAREIVDAIFAAVQEFRGDTVAERRHDRGGGQDHEIRDRLTAVSCRAGCRGLLPDVKAERLAAEDRHFVDPALDTHARAAGHRAAAVATSR